MGPVGGGEGDFDGKVAGAGRVRWKRAERIVIEVGVDSDSVTSAQVSGLSGGFAGGEGRGVASGTVLVAVGCIPA